MPTYEYRCKECGNELEVVQSFTDDALTTCDACGGPLRKVFGNVGISFKGSGFYKNDSRGKAGSAAAGASAEATSSTESTTSTGADSSTKTDTKPDTKTSEAKPDKKPAAPPAKKADTASKS